MQIFEYGQKEIEYLKKKDKKLGATIDKIGIIQRGVTLDPFYALISSVVSQQISKKAAETVLNRILKLIDNITPESIANLNLSEIQACGMSERKAGYIKGIAETAISKTVDFNYLLINFALPASATQSVSHQLSTSKILDNSANYWNNSVADQDKLVSYGGYQYSGY